MTTIEKLQEAQKTVEALKTQLKDEIDNTPTVGYWFKSSDPDSHFCVFVESVSLCGEVFQFYGWDSANDWGTWGSGSFTNKPHYLRVDDSEIEQRMYEELVRRGFKDGIEMNREKLDCSSVSCDVQQINFFNKDRVEMDGHRNNVIFLDGNVVFAHGLFAELVEDSLLIRGYSFEIDKKNGYVKFGCKSFGDRCVEAIQEEIYNFNADGSTDLKIGSITLEDGTKVSAKDLKIIVAGIKKYRDAKS